MKPFVRPKSSTCVYRAYKPALTHSDRRKWLVMVLETLDRRGFLGFKNVREDGKEGS